MTHQPLKETPPSGCYGLLKYDAACLAIKEASEIDEVQEFLGKAEAMQIYGRQIKNTDLQNRAAMIRIRAQHRLGELLRETERNDGRGRGHDDGPRSPKTLKQLGITKSQSSACQKLAAVPSEKIDTVLAKIATARQELTTSSVLRAVNPKKNGAPKKKSHCTITAKNIEDTRCLSMAQYRLHYCGEKIKILLALRADPRLGLKARKVLKIYARAFQEFSTFTSGGIRQMEQP